LDDGRIGPDVAQRQKASEKPVESARATLAMIRRDRVSDGQVAREPAAGYSQRLKGHILKNT
jgi:hypothetical protein